MILVEEIPHQYGLCLNGDCPLAATCLRRLALAAVPETRHFATVLLPHRCTPDANGHYPYYRSNTPVRYARGFSRILATFPVKTLEAFRNRLIGLYPRNKYFKMRKGTILLAPDEQALIMRIARDKGFQGEFTFDRYEEHYLWE